jgi:hypothetical protein
MIGARNHADAMNEALRSYEQSKETDLQIWDGEKYINVTKETPC